MASIEIDIFKPEYIDLKNKILNYHVMNKTSNDGSVMFSEYVKSLGYDFEISRKQCLDDPLNAWKKFIYIVTGKTSDLVHFKLRYI